MTTHRPDAPREREPRGFVRTLGRVDVLFLGFGSMIGFGWIVLTGGWIQEAGTLGAVTAFLVGGVIMALVGLVYSELVSAMPLAGGEHNYLLRGMGPRAALLGSWGIVGGYVTVILFQSVAVPRSLTYLFPDLPRVELWTIAGADVHLTWALVGSVTAIALTWLNIRGIRQAGLFQTSAVLFLIVVGLVLTASAFLGGRPEYTEPLFDGGGAGIIAVLVVVPFLFVGFDVIPQSAEEARIPPRQIGRLVVVSVVMAAVFYIVIVVTTSLATPTDALSGMDLATADAMAHMLGHPFWGQFVVAGGLAGIVTTWNAFLIGVSRLMWAMARSGMIPRWFGVLHPRNGTPVNALLFIGALSTASPFVGIAMLDWAVDSGGPSIVITYLMVSVVFLLLRRREPGLERPMRVGGAREGWGILVGVAAVVTTAVLLVLYLPGMPASLSLEPWLMFTAWWLLGLVFVLRIPAGVRAGPGAEEELIARIEERRRGRG
ncbi:APC family permease [Nocardiopsis sp. MG754419]|uniref:APC family permease n=1 Tax=Nocardiopsis sp. MG754419 TaxID=2259865 RepID=UPI001BADF81F|nr:APC family permease [Nocardiopsis sp. MG754419]MBR8742676.1 amino acid permease [Nocardiopsis sp. MG754419]